MRKALPLLLLGILVAASAHAYPRRVLVEEFTSHS